MPLPLIGQIATTAGGAALNAGIGSLVTNGINSLFGGGQQASYEDIMKAILEAQNDMARENASIATQAAEEATTDAENEVNKVAQDYSNEVTKKEWKTAFKQRSGPGSYVSLADSVFDYNSSPEAAAQKMLASATEAGLKPTSMVKVPGHGRVTLMKAARDLVNTYESKAPELWTEYLSKMYADEMGRLPTKEELQKYNYRDYKSLTAVREDLAKDNEYFERNVRTLDPQLAAMRTYLSGYTTMPSNYIPYGSSSAPRTTPTTTKAKSFSSGIDFRDPKPRVGVSDNISKSNQDYATFS